MNNPIDLRKRLIGVNFTPSEVAEIWLWAPLAKQAEILLTEKNKILSLIKEEHGYWSLLSSEVKPGDKYFFVLDGQKHRPDPASLSQPEGVHGPSAAIVLNDFSWSDHRWKNLPLRDYIFYELHTGTFSDEGTLRGIAEKLDHLIKLGVNAIEIMPVSQFPGNRNWGYDGVFPFAVQFSYGGASELQQLVDACHQKGLAVVLDVVYNHMGPEGNYFGDFGPYFTDKYHTPWGNALNFDDAQSDAVRRYFIENVLMWFRDFHIDALRLDAVHAIKDLSPAHMLREIKEYVNSLSAKTGRKYYLIAEVDLNDPRFIKPLEKQGYGMDAQWIDEFHHALRVSAGGPRSGYYADFNGIQHLGKAYQDAYVYDGIYSPHRLKTFGSKTDNPGEQFVVFSQNHDQIGNRMLGERSSQLFSFEMQKLMAGAVMIAPFLPMLFMGEEWSEPHPFQYFVSHTDPALAEAVRKGRKAEFGAFHAEGEAPDPMAEKTFLDSKLQWKLLDQPENKTMFRYYQALVSIRKREPALYDLNRHSLTVAADEEAQTLQLIRWYENEQICCFLNFAQEERKMQLPDSGDSWHKLIGSSDPEWNGPEKKAEQLYGRTDVVLSPASIIIYKNSYV
ncbi:MAG: malto-oligosyltrehalose trehalohydrolase [Sphingobacteriaceae bacterium]